MLNIRISLGTFYETNIYEKFRTYLGFKNLNPSVFIFYPNKVFIKIEGSECTDECTKWFDIR